MIEISWVMPPPQREQLEYRYATKKSPVVVWSPWQAAELVAAPNVGVARTPGRDHLRGELAALVKKLEGEAYICRPADMQDLQRQREILGEFGLL